MGLLPERFQTVVWDVAYYTTVIWYQLIRFRRPSGLLKANYGIDHGGFAFASKYKIQEYIGHQHFPSTVFVAAGLTYEEKRTIITNFAALHGYPVMLKPDSGYVGKGVCKIDNTEDIDAALPRLAVDYLVQAFVPGDVEFGLFYVRIGDEIIIPSINQKFYPAVVGDGKHTVPELAKLKPEYTEAWETYIKETDQVYIPRAGEKMVLSYIGSNTLGSLFIDVSHVASEPLVKELGNIFADAPGVNYGRLDVKATSLEKFEQGAFTVIEVNGVASLPTNMMDPEKSFFSLLSIMHRHADLLVATAYQYRSEEMEVLGLGDFITRNKELMATVEKQHNTVTQS